MSKLLLPFFLILFSFSACGLTLNTTITDVVVSDVSINKSPIVQTQGTKFIKDGEPFYFVGVNCFQLVYTWIQDQALGTTVAEDYFDEWVADGVKVVRVIMYVLGDTVLADPDTAPTCVAINGGSLIDGKTYVYRYAVCNYSKTASTYDKATTLCSPITSVAITAPNQSVHLTMSHVDYGYRYEIYRRESTDAVDSEEYLGVARACIGKDATYIDDGTGSPSGAIPVANDTTSTARGTISGQNLMFMRGMGNYLEAKFIAWDNILELAREHGVMIMPTLLDRQNNLTGGVKDFMLQSGRETLVHVDGSYDDLAWSEETCNALVFYKDWLTRFIGRTNTVNNRLYKEDPTIFAWELMNEPWGLGTGKEYKGWMTQVIEHIKTIDTKHMIGAGGTGEVLYRGTAYSGDAGNTGHTHDFITHSNTKGIDFCSWHIAPNMPGAPMDSGGYDNSLTPTAPIDFNTFKQIMQKKADWAGSFIRKPIVFGELNMNDWNDTGTWIPDVSQAILDVRPNETLGDNLLLNPDFQDGLTDWTFTAECSIDTLVTYNQRQTLKVVNDGSAEHISFYQTVTLIPGTDYWWKIILQKPDDWSGHIYFNIVARVDPGDAWTTAKTMYISEDNEYYQGYWTNYDFTRFFASHGYHKWKSGKYTEAKLEFREWTGAADIWIAEVEFRPYEIGGGDTVYGGAMWWNWGTANFDKNNATVRTQLQNAADLYD